MDYQALTVISGFAFAYSLIGWRLERTPINGALVYVLAGFLCSSLGWLNVSITGEGLMTLAEITLALVLFTDSANTNLTTLAQIKSIPTRLLLVGLPLTLVLGMGVGYLIFDDLSLLELALLSTMLAPTDAALAKSIVTNEDVPDSIRESLNVESGLNDGICVPIMLLLIAFASGDANPEAAPQLFLTLPLQAIGIGAIVGVVGGVLGSQLLRLCTLRQWLAGTWIQIPVISLALLCFGASQWLGGSGFIACFVGGLFLGALAKRHKQEYLDACEGIGDFMALLTWFIGGAAAIVLTLPSLDWKVLLYSLSSLTLIRMLPVFVSVSGLDLRLDTKCFLGWFGPRGLASIVFAVMVRSQDLPGNDILLTTVTWTILLSVLLHGITANPLGSIYGKRTEDRNGVI